MEARALKAGVKGNLPAKLNYLFPSRWNAVPQGVNSTQAHRAQALGLGDRLMCDLHCTWWLTNRPDFQALDLSMISDVRPPTPTTCALYCGSHCERANAQANIRCR
eukprot:COSAG01_NODE_3954_length_5498_cov_5.490646_3_plen_106_part_00